MSALCFPSFPLFLSHVRLLFCFFNEKREETKTKQNKKLLLLHSKFREHDILHSSFQFLFCFILHSPPTFFFLRVCVCVFASSSPVYVFLLLPPLHGSGTAVDVIPGQLLGPVAWTSTLAPASVLSAGVLSCRPSLVHQLTEQRGVRKPGGHHEWFTRG